MSNDPFKLITDKLLDTFSESNLNAIALKVADKYNDGAVSDSLSIAPPVLKDIKPRTNLFDNSDKAFVDSFAPDSAIADEVAFEIVEGFNS